MSWAFSIRGREDWWNSSGTNGWATCIVVGVLFGFYTLRILVRPLVRAYLMRRSTKLSPSSDGYAINSVSGGSPVVSESDLQRLLTLLDESGHSSGIPWTPVVDKRSDTLSYHAELREPEDGCPTEYLSTSHFRNCTATQLKDFYMDSQYRLSWDKTFESYELLLMDEKIGYEIGRFVKRFPFVRPREYVMAWRLWEGDDGSYYYFAKGCEHPQAPRSPMYTRIEHYMSGWRIRRDGDGCEIKMWHQEDTTSMAKMAFSCRIWNYMCDMERSLRKYRPAAQNAPLQIPRVPTSLLRSISCPAAIQAGLMTDPTVGYKRRKKLSIKQSGKWMASGMLVLGGAMFCARRSAPVGVKMAAVYAINKLVQPSTSVKPLRQHFPAF